MSRCPHLTPLLCFVAIILSVLASAGNLEPEHAALRRCGAVSDQAQRLACFDAIVSKLPQTEADRFGMTADIQHRRDPLATQPPQIKLDGGIASVSLAARGERTFTLDDQQVWIEAEPAHNVEFAVGESVQIVRGALSSFWLVADRHRRVRITRLR